MPRPRKLPSPFRYFNSSPEVIRLVVMIAYIDDDEMVEVTLKSIRLRECYLDPHERKRASRAKMAA